MTLEDWNSFFQLASAVLLGLTFFVGAAAIITAQMVGRRQAELIATVGLDAADANKKAAEAREGTARALADAAAANESASRLEIEAAQQREKAAKAERELLELQERIRPRRITDEQRARLVELLRKVPKGPVIVRSVMGDAEGNALAEQIDAIFKVAGWTTDGVTYSAYSGGNPTGLFGAVQSAATAPTHATSIQQVFDAVGIPLPGTENARVPANTLEIVVGIKP